MMIWLFALDRTPASWRCITSRSPYGRWATSDRRFPWSAGLEATADRRTSPMSARIAPGRMHAATMFDLMRGDRARVAANAFRTHPSTAREFDLNSVSCVQRVSSRVGRPPQAARVAPRPKGSWTRGIELLREEQNVLWFDGLLLKMALAQAEAQGEIPAAPSSSSTKRWRRATTPVVAHLKQSCIGREAKRC